jgi:hypothetical protein
LQTLLGADADIRLYRPTLRFQGKHVVHVPSSTDKDYEDGGADCTPPEKVVPGDEYA